MWHPELPEMKAEAVVVALLRFPVLWVRKDNSFTGAPCESLERVKSTRVKWVPFVLSAVFVCFIVFFASKLAIFHLNHSVLGA